jgi:hypothetical protein
MLEFRQSFKAAVESRGKSQQFADDAQTTAEMLRK